MIEILYICGKPIKIMKKILVLIDCQNDFITGSLRNTKAIKAVPKIVKKIREFNGDAIIYTMDTHGENYLDTKEGKVLDVEHCIKGTEGWQIQGEINSELVGANLRGIRVFEVQKPTFGAVNLYKDIESVVKNSEGVIEEFDIEFVGFCTDICVVSNVLMTKAHFYEKANIVVDSNCCAGTSVENHDSSLDVMRSCQIEIV